MNEKPHLASRPGAVLCINQLNYTPVSPHHCAHPGWINENSSSSLLKVKQNPIYT